MNATPIADWTIAELASVCHKIQDGAHHSPKVTHEVQKPGTFPYVTSKNIRHWRIDHEKLAYVDREYHDSIYPRCNAELGDVLLTKDGANTGQVAINTFNEPISLLSSVCLIKPNPEKLDSRFLVYYIQSDEGFESISGRMTGAAIKRIVLNRIKASEIPLPPLAEQKRIVAKLDQAFAALDRARANAEANLIDANEAYRLAVAEVLQPNGADAISVGLGDISRIRAGSGFPEANQGALEGEYPFYKVSDMNLPGNEEYLSVANNYISEVVQERLGAFVFPAGTVVFPKVGGAIATNKKRVLTVKSCVDNNIMGLIPNVEKVSPDFLHELMLAINIYELSNKANPPSITQATVSTWPVQIPSMEQQARVVDRVRRLRRNVDDLKVRYSRQVADVSALRQSLLQAAFSGQLS